MRFLASAGRCRCLTPTRSGPSANAHQGRRDQRLFELFDQELRAAGYLAMSGQLVYASIIAAPSSSTPGREACDLGRPCAADWQDMPSQLRQKYRERAGPSRRPRPSRAAGETPMVDLAILEFGYQNHISADRRHRLIRKWLLTDSAAHSVARFMTRASRSDDRPTFFGGVAGRPPWLLGLGNEQLHGARCGLPRRPGPGYWRRGLCRHRDTG